MAIKVAVVGAGIVGLAAAAELRRAGAEVRCFEKAAAPGQAESAGLTRIFRAAHGNPLLVRLALRARDRWCDWESRYGRELLGKEGLIVSGDEMVPRWTQAMRHAGAPCRPLSTHEILSALPPYNPANCAALWDSSAGAIRARGAVECLQADLAAHIVHAEIIRLTETGEGMRVHTAAESWQCDEVLITAGIATPMLAAQLAMNIPLSLVRHARLTFRPRETGEARPAACLIANSDQDGVALSIYGQPVAGTGTYAIGVEALDSQPPSLDPAAVSRYARPIAQRFVRSAFPGLDPEPISELQCTFNDLGFPDGDGFAAVRRGAATFFAGNNMFKFAPLLGDLLAQAIMHHEVPAELSAFQLSLDIP
jgi:sarcosine oxidase